MKCKLQTLTPVHTGSGQIFQSGVDFLYDGKSAGIIDEVKVLEIIGEDNIDHWVNMIRQRHNLLDYLRKRKNDLNLQDVCRRTMKVFSNEAGYRQQMREQYHTSGKACIPGSSIKGAIRTGILSEIVKQNASIINESEIKTNKGYSGDHLENKFLGNKRKNRDLFRFIRITDAMFNEETRILDMQVLNYVGDEWKFKRGTAQLAESIAENNETHIEISLEEMKNELYFKQEVKLNKPEWLKSYYELFGMINRHTNDLLEKEIDFTEKNMGGTHADLYLGNLKKIKSETEECLENETILRLGFGSGWTWMTGGWIKYETDILNDDDWNGLSDRLGKKGAPFFPKTRKMDIDSNLLGFIKLTIEK